jgi:chaperonin GroEL
MDKATQTLLGKDALKAIRAGVNAIYEPVRRTFGPQGKNGLIYRTWNRGTRITNDGFANSEVIEPKNMFVRMAATTFKEACQRTDKKVGDGTTATTILAGHLFNSASAIFDTQSDAVANQTTSVLDVKKKILDTAKVVKDKILKAAVRVEDLEQLEKIAKISIEDEKLGKTIAKLAWDIGVDGHIDVVEGYKGHIETDISTGFRFPAKIVDKAFVNKKERYEMVVEDAPVLVTNYKLDNANEINKLLAKFNTQTSKIIVIAPSFSQNVLVSMVTAIQQGYFIFPVKVPALRTEQFEDLAVYCNAEFINKEVGRTLSNVDYNELGFLEKLVVKDTEVKEDAVATGGRGTRILDGVESPVDARIKVLKGQKEETKQDQFKKLLDRRIASMASAVGTIRVGAASDAEIYYQKLKIEDGVYACKAAIRGGYVKGGGLCLKEIADELDDKDLLKETLLAPYKQIQTSTGGAEIGEDIIDPAEVLYYAVEHATSVVANLLTVDIMTQEIPDMYPGEGEMAMAKQLKVLAFNDAVHKGQLKESQREQYIDENGGFMDEELIQLDNG